MDKSWHDTPFGQIWKSALGAIKRSFTHRAPKFGGIRGRSETFLLVKSCTEINVFNKQPISLASFLALLPCYMSRSTLCTNTYFCQTATGSTVSRKIAWQWKAMKAVVWFLLTVHMSVRKHFMWRGICKSIKVVVHKALSSQHNSCFSTPKLV